LIYLRDCSSTDVRNSSSSDNHLVIASLNVRSFGNKVHDLLEVRRDRLIDVLCLVETGHDTDAVCFRRLRFDGFQVNDRPRPRSAGESSLLSTNHGGVAVVAVPGVHLSSFDAVSNPTSFELLCTLIKSGKSPASSLLYIVLAQRPSHLRSSMTYRTLSTALSDTMNRSSLSGT